MLGHVPTGSEMKGPVMDDRNVELAELLRRLGSLADSVHCCPTRTDVDCLEVIRLTEAAHSIAGELLREVANGG